MPSFRTRIAIGIVAVPVVLAVGAPAPAVAQAAASRFLVAMPRAEAEIALSGRTAGLGLGVYPESRDPLAFIREIGSGAPSGGSADELGGEPGRLGRALAEAGVDAVVANGGPAELRRALAFALQIPLRTAARKSGVVGAALSSAFELQRLLADAGEFSTAIVLGVSESTPLLVGVVGVPLLDLPETTRGWVWTDGIARRPAIVTPYDVTATLLDSLGLVTRPFGLRPPTKTFDVPGSAFIGRSVSFAPPRAATALDDVRRLELRLVRDARSSGGLAVTAVVTAILLMIGAAVMRRVGRRDLAIRAAQGSWFLAAAYPAAQFVPTGRTEIRAPVLLALLLIGAAIPIRGAPRLFARVAFAAAILFAFLIVLGPLRPGGEPGLSLWGNPLVSWRFFGLQNGQAAVLAAGVVVWGVVAGLGPRLFAAAAVVVAVLVAAPKVGANFVGVLTFAFGATLAFLALVRRRVEMWHLAVSTVFAGAALALALVSDAASPLSHGGRAARRISEGGLDTAWRFVRARLELNVELIRDMFAGPLLVVMLVVAIGALLIWSVRGPASARVRAAVWGGAAMALASLVLEDSGFYSGGILALAAAAAWMIGAAGEERDAEISRPASPSAGAG